MWEADYPPPPEKKKEKELQVMAEYWRELRVELAVHPSAEAREKSGQETLPAAPPVLDHSPAAERASPAAPQPPVEALGVEPMAALREHPELLLAEGGVVEADGAPRLQPAVDAALSSTCAHLHGEEEEEEAAAKGGECEEEERDEEGNQAHEVLSENGGGEGGPLFRHGRLSRLAPSWQSRGNSFQSWFLSRETVVDIYKGGEDLRLFMFLNREGQISRSGLSSSSSLDEGACPRSEPSA